VILNTVHLDVDVQELCELPETEIYPTLRCTGKSYHIFSQLADFSTYLRRVQEQQSPNYQKQSPRLVAQSPTYRRLREVTPIEQAYIFLNLMIFLNSISYTFNRLEAPCSSAVLGYLNFPHFNTC
jgi:hypothetical protein